MHDRHVRGDHPLPPEPAQTTQHGTLRQAHALGQKARKRKDGAYEHAFPVGKLPAGGYLVTAEVRDDTDWVVKDEKHLLAERVSWRVKVALPAKPEAAAPPSPSR